MNRRSFFRSLGIATAAVYLRLAPEKVLAMQHGQKSHYGALTLEQYNEYVEFIFKKRTYYDHDFQWFEKRIRPPSHNPGS